MIPSDRIREIIRERDQEFSPALHNSGLPMHGALYAVIKYLDEQADKQPNEVRKD